MLPFLAFTGNNDIRYTGNSYLFDGSTYDFSEMPNRFRTLYGPNMIYSNGRTYVGVKTNQNTTAEKAGIVEYYNGVVTLQWMDRDADSEDRHDSIRLIDDGTGKITLFLEQHNPFVSMGKVQVWRMSVANDITSFVYKGLSSEFGDYCKPYYRESDNSIICFGRRDPIAASGDGNLYMSIYDNDTTWSTPVRVTEHQSTTPPVGTLSELRYYPTCFANHDSSNSNWRYLFFTRRLGNTSTGNQIYREHFVLKFNKSSPYVIHNASSSFSKDVQSSGHITWSELLANFNYATNTIAAGGVANGAIIENQFYSKVTVDGVNEIYYFNGTSINFVSGSLGGYPMDLNNATSSNSGEVRILKYQNLQLIKITLIDTPTNGAWNTNSPLNFNKIPRGQKFAVCVGTLKNGDTSTEGNTNENDLILYEMIR